MKKVLIVSLVIGASITIAQSGRSFEIVNDAPLATTPQATASVSAYTLGRVEENDADPCIGAYNNDLCAMVKAGASICASNGYPKNTKLKIVELDIECVVLDKMNRRYQEGYVDIAMLDHRQALEFGRKVLHVEVVR